MYFGFLTNNNVYFNNLKYKIKFPRLPHFGIFGDNDINKFGLNEFERLSIPFFSCIENQTTFFKNSCYSLASNCKSLDSLI